MNDEYYSVCKELGCTSTGSCKPETCTIVSQFLSKCAINSTVYELPYEQWYRKGFEDGVNYVKEQFRD